MSSSHKRKTSTFPPASRPGSGTGLGLRLAEDKLGERDGIIGHKFIAGILIQFAQAHMEWPRL